MNLLRNTLSVIAIGLAVNVTAQKKNVTSAAVVYKNQYLPAMMKGKIEDAKKSLLEAKKYIDLASEHEETKDEQKTFWLKGEIYGAFFDVVMASAQKGSIDSSFIKEAGENPLEESIKAFKKGYPLGKKYKSYIAQGVDKKRMTFNQMGGMLFDMKQYEPAAGMYDYQAKYADAVGMLDSSAVYNAALSFGNAEKHEEAAKRYEKLVKAGYKVNITGALASEAYRKAGKVDQAEAVINEARKKYPSDKGLLLQLVNTKLDAGDKEGAQKALEDAIAADAENKQLYYTIGTINFELNEYEKATESLNKALEIDPEYEDALYQLGAVLVSWGTELKAQANKLPLGDPRYNDLDAKSNEKFKQALIPLEKYISKNPNDKQVLTILFQINRKLGNSEKALEYKKKADALK